jgi:hypothetical protein
VATFGWNGPVLASQKVRPILISLLVERALTVLRVMLLLALAYILLNARRARPLIFGHAARAGIFALVLAGSAFSGQAQLPDQEMINTLRKRLLERSDATPCGDIPSIAIRLDDRRMIIVPTSMPYSPPFPPGHFWLDLTSVSSGEPAPVRRDDNYLWVVVPEGVHKVHRGSPCWRRGMAAYFASSPAVNIDAPDWNVSGVGRACRRNKFSLFEEQVHDR